MNKIFSKLVNLKFLRLNRTLKSEFSNIKNEMDEHLLAINENTNEISANYEYIHEIESKLDRICERLDKMQMFLEKIYRSGKKEMSTAKITKMIGENLGEDSFLYGHAGEK